jgi:hypothetical protein
VTGGKPVDVLLQSISGVGAINPLVVFYDIHGGKREVFFLSRTLLSIYDMILIAYLQFIKKLAIFSDFW